MAEKVPEFEWRKKGHLKELRKGLLRREKIKMRWCVVEKNVLRIYTNSQENELKEEVCLDSCEFFRPVMNEEKESNEIIFQLNFSEKKILKFIASADEYSNWRDAIIRGKMFMTLPCLKECRENDKVQRIVLLGKTGNGKSATGNSILDDKVFVSALQNESVTKKCRLVGWKRFGISLEIVDTPGLYDTELSIEETLKEISKCICLSAPGPHAFLLIMKTTSRFTKEEDNVIKKFVSHFGEAIYQYFIIVFTGKDQLDSENRSTASFLEGIPENLRKLLSKCNGRCFFMNNKDSDGNKAKQVLELLNVVHNNSCVNNMSFYSNDDFETATTALKKRAEEIRKAEEEKRKKERELIEKEFEEKKKKIIDKRGTNDKEKEKQIKELQDEKETVLQNHDNKESNYMDKAKAEIEEEDQQSFLSTAWSNLEAAGHSLVSAVSNFGRGIVKQPVQLISSIFKPKKEEETTKN